jgi:hypothetical protein
MWNFLFYFLKGYTISSTWAIINTNFNENIFENAVSERACKESWNVIHLLKYIGNDVFFILTKFFLLYLQLTLNPYPANVENSVS